ncbi:MAG: FAD-binding protein [Oscillospiraceae bacterium]|nr:FAD-binding protein [Oscillospiraceae bacterium]
MSGIKINNDVVIDKSIKDVRDICPFSAIDYEDGKFKINSKCRICKLCVKNGPKGLFEFVDETKKLIDKGEWRNVAVYIEQMEGNIHPVSLELLGKSREIADKIGQKVTGIFIGNDIIDKAEELLHYGIDEVFCYGAPWLEHFLIEPYANVFADFIYKNKPSVILVGATVVGRSLAPRVAARFRTGLTADCTKIDIKENTDLIQIRPAFGGNIMAQINTPNNRPQIATVRYKIFDAPVRSQEKSGIVNMCSLNEDWKESRITQIEAFKKEKSPSISDADMIVAIGRGVKSKKDLDMIYRLAKALNAEVAGTRPVIESGMLDPSRQIGLSGRAVKPKLIITIGVSGSVQFKAGMEGSSCIVAINSDENAQIFNFCNYAIVGDLYEIVPLLTKKIEEGGLNL